MGMFEDKQLRRLYRLGQLDLARTRAAERLLLEPLRELIKERLKHYNTTQTDLAKAIGVRQSLVSMFLSGKAGLSIESIALACYTLGIDITASLHNEKAKS